MKSLRVFLIVFAILIFSPSFAKAADICDDINDLSNVWNDIANFMNEHEEDGFNNAEADELVRLVNEILPATAQLAGALIELGDETETELGKRLNSFIRELESTERGDLVAYLVDVMDDITDSLDAIVDYCDGQR